MKRKKTKELIAENKWLMSLPVIPRTIVGVFWYRFTEFLITIFLLIGGAWLVTSVYCIDGKLQVKPGVTIEHKTINQKIQGME